MSCDFVNVLNAVLRYRLGDDAFTEAVFHLQQGAVEGGDAHRAAVERFGQTLKAAGDPRHHVVAALDQTVPPDPHVPGQAVQHVFDGTIFRHSYRLRYHPETGKFAAHYSFHDGNDQLHKFQTLLGPEQAREFAAAFPSKPTTYWRRKTEYHEGDTDAEALRFVDDARGKWPPPEPPKPRLERTPPPVTDRPLTNDEVRRDFMENMLSALKRMGKPEGGATGGD